MTGIYILITFCESKCVYCAFSSFVNREKENDYFSHLKKEIDNTSKSIKDNVKKVDSIYFGGGTPSVISSNKIKAILDCIKENFVINDDCEITIEANPNSLDKQKLVEYKNMGINRLSIGIQSLYDEELNFLGRKHNRNMAIEAIKSGKNSGFENISVDLLIGIKGQTKNRFVCELNELISLGIKHFSCYMLQVEEGTKLYNIVKENEKEILDEDECVKIYEECVRTLEENGFVRYEISNFALNGYESRHNLKYWSGENYIGLGLSAHSYLDGTRFANSNNFEGYFAGEKSLCEKLSDSQRIEELIMLGLRCRLGVDNDKLKQFGYDLTQNEYFKNFVRDCVLIKEGEIIKLNPQYYGVSNFIITRLLP